ncbi:glutamine synthetase [Streptomyces kaniharaensis]|uniref:Glutamine synthetase n=1 Tax=Streptomyces kaniharaensis TaxID=212423 RepID=A0A6N7KSZ1_9ACTN|nr:glutamine synthetase family protein [Streptomyces kaniharaensis]MQS14716.1 glutamine synthetase [Streptomyces kaniharaensis]
MRVATRSARSRAARAAATVQSPVGPLHGLVDAFGLDTVLLAAIDVQGRLKGKTYDAQVLLERLRSGRITPEMCGYVIGTDLGMSTPQHGAFASWNTGYGDIALLPDLASARLLPWLPGAALVLAEPIEDSWPHPLAPTTLLNQQLTHLAGLGLNVAVGIETEFILYEGTVGQAAAAGWRQLRPATWDNRDYAIDQPSTIAAFSRRLRQVLGGAGLPVEAVKLEGAAGQVEVTFPYGEPRLACEQHLLFKHAVRATAEEHGLAPTFMASPATGVSSGMHLHVSLYRDDQPVLGSGREETGLSELGEQAVAGLLEVLPQTAPLWAPYVNSYKRFAKHSFAPARFAWGRDNRSCAVRVVGHGGGLHLEVRLPGADANPHLALAAVLAGVRHGIEAGLKPRPASEGDAYRDAEAPLIPRHLADAVRTFEASTLAADLLGERQVAHLSAVARLDVDDHAACVTNAEVERGFAQA